MTKHFLTHSLRWLVVKQVEVQKALNEASADRAREKTPSSIARYKALLEKKKALRSIWRSHPDSFDLDVKWLCSEQGSKQHKFAKNGFPSNEVSNILMARRECWLSSGEIRQLLSNMNNRQFSQFSTDVQRKAVERTLHRFLIAEKVRRRKSTRFSNEFEWQLFKS